MVPLRAKHFTALSWGWGANTLIIRSLCNDYHLLLRLRLQRQMARCTEAIHQTPKRNFVFLPHLASSSLHHFLPLLILHLFYFNLSCYCSPRGQGLTNVKKAVPLKYIGWQWTHYPSYIPLAGAREGRWKSTASSTSFLDCCSAEGIVFHSHEEEPQSYLLLAAQLLLITGHSTGCSSRCLESVSALFPIISLTAGTESLVSCRLVLHDWLKLV